MKDQFDKIKDDFDWDFWGDPKYWDQFKDYHEPTEEEQAIKFRADNWDNPIMRVKFLYQDALKFIPMHTEKEAEIFNFFHIKLYEILKDFGEA